MTANGQARRLSAEAAGALASSLAALIVAAASAVTALQALQVNQRNAQQDVFNSQVQACLALTDATAELEANDASVQSAIAAPPDPSGARTLVQSRSALLEHGYATVLKLTMLFPASALGQTAQRNDASHLDMTTLQQAVLSDGEVSPDELRRVAAADIPYGKQLLSAGEHCRAYVSSVVDGKAKSHV